MAYDPGWKTTVDGKQISNIRVHGGLTGLELSAGNHQVVMEYTVPGLKTGVLLSLLGCLIVMGYFVKSRKRLGERNI